MDSNVKFFVNAGVVVLVLVASTLFGMPQYCVWQQSLSGKAELAKAEQNRKILINEAKAKKDAAKYWAQAEVERAKGASKANEILAKSLGGSEGYLRWLFIDKLDQIQDQIIYIPTEAAMPILEAGKRR